MVPLNLDIYVCERSEQEKNQTFKKLKNINNQKQYLLLKIILKNFALAILGGVRAWCAPPPPLNPPVHSLMVFLNVFKVLILEKIYSTDDKKTLQIYPAWIEITLILLTLLLNPSHHELGYTISCYEDIVIQDQLASSNGPRCTLFFTLLVKI